MINAASNGQATVACLFLVDFYNTSVLRKKYKTRCFSTPALLIIFYFGKRFDKLIVLTNFYIIP